MAETWPAGVPTQTRTNSWRLVKPFRDPHRTQMEDGPSRSRRSSTKKFATIAFTIIPMTGDQFEDFKEWVENTMVDGTLPDGFTMSVWNGKEYVSRVCHFVNDPAYEAAPEGRFMVVSLVIDVESL